VTDQLEYLFADLRAGTKCEVRPPGAIAARRALRRRRTNRTVGAAAFLVVAGAGGVTATMALSPRGEQIEPADRAAALAGVDPDAPGSVRGVARSGVTGTEVMVAGTYTLAVACVGRGWVSVTLRSAKGQVAEARTHCTEGQQLNVVVRFDVSSDGPVTTEVRADDQAAGQAGFAYQVRAMG
jgi:hypothetical protein